ncbi:SCO4402 family protein [Nonomuraea sp. NPDC004702]
MTLSTEYRGRAMRSCAPAAELVKGFGGQIGDMPRCPAGLLGPATRLIDDTFIDQHAARTLIPHLFFDQREADLVQTVVVALLQVLDHLGPTAPDHAYLDPPEWTNVLNSAGAAYLLLSSDKHGS